jgi:hypothetical protein
MTMAETETVTRKDWVLFMLAIAFVVFLAVAIFIIVTNPPKEPEPVMRPMTTLLHTWH